VIPDLSLIRALAELAHRAPDTRSLVADDGRVLTARDLLDGAHGLAGELHHRGLRPGDRVAWAGRNDPGCFITMLAAHLAGAVFVPLNFRLTTAEATRTLEHCTPHTVVVEPELEPVYAPLTTSRAVQHWMSAAEASAARRALPGHADLPSVVPDDLAVIVYTSGTSGRPKGVMLTHANMWWSQRSMGALLDTRPDDVVLVVAPVFHIAGLNCFTLDALGRGGTLVLRRAFDPARALADLAGVTVLFGVPAMYSAITRTPGFDRADLSGVRTAIVGGASAQTDIFTRFAARGMTIRPSWGMTELAGGGAVLPATMIRDRPLSVGQAVPYLDLSLRSPEGGSPVVTPGVTGEIWVRGPQVTAGYWADPDATAAARAPGGWWRTADLATQDAEGCLTLVGRTFEVVNTGGEKVVPGEVEAALRGLPVDDLVVVGAPDPTWGETVVAVLACDADDAPTLETVRETASSTIARYKLPTRVVVVADLPRTASGKVDRLAARALAASTP
jgi:fatty-acyl-CoA synthase